PYSLPSVAIPPTCSSSGFQRFPRVAGTFVDFAQSEMDSDSGSEFELGKAAESTDLAVDRLSNLPDLIIHHILSFLDTKYAVQTSVLSRVWRSFWKQLDVLCLRRSNFRDISSFIEFVERVLSLRFQLDVRRVSFIDDVGPAHLILLGVLNEVANYAIAHGCRHLVIDLELEQPYITLYYFLPPLRCCLETLEIRNVIIVYTAPGVGDHFPSLTTLILKTCPLLPDQHGNVDLISNFPCLTDLVIHKWNTTNWLADRWKIESLAIHGHQLVNLELAALPDYDIQIVAPKLQLLKLQLFADRTPSWPFSKLSLGSLPSLDHANIMLIGLQEKETDLGWNSLFRGLHDANSAVLGCTDKQVLKNLCDFLERDPPPFTKLKCLVCLSSEEPDRMISYYLDGSSSLRRRLESE
ncbi:F-box/LRR-repeat protein At4g14103, partial [Linum grandiflorum]